MSKGLIKEIDNRVKSLGVSKKIVNVTEITTLANLSKHTKRANLAHDYFNVLLQSVSNLSNELFLNKNQEEEKHLVIVITSNKGLCGMYNLEVNKILEKMFEEQPEFKNATFMTIGKNADETLRKYNIEKIIPQNFDLNDCTLEETAIIGKKLVAKIDKKEVTNITVVFTKYIGPAKNEAMKLEVFPYIPVVEAESDIEEPISQLEFEDESSVLFEKLFTNYITGFLYSIFLYSIASEFSARQIAMQTAKEGIDDKLDNLKKERRKIKSNVNNNALIEIIMGAKIMEDE